MIYFLYQNKVLGDAPSSFQAVIERFGAVGPRRSFTPDNYFNPAHHVFIETYTLQNSQVAKKTFKGSERNSILVRPEVPTVIFIHGYMGGDLHESMQTGIIY